MGNEIPPDPSLRRKKILAVAVIALVAVVLVVATVILIMKRDAPPRSASVTLRDDKQNTISIPLASEGLVIRSLGSGFIQLIKDGKIVTEKVFVEAQLPAIERAIKNAGYSPEGLTIVGEVPIGATGKTVEKLAETSTAGEAKITFTLPPEISPPKSGSNLSDDAKAAAGEVKDAGETVPASPYVPGPDRVKDLGGGSYELDPRRINGEIGTPLNRDELKSTEKTLQETYKQGLDGFEISKLEDGSYRFDPIKPPVLNLTPEKLSGEAIGSDLTKLGEDNVLLSHATTLDGAQSIVQSPYFKSNSFSLNGTTIEMTPKQIVGEFPDLDARSLHKSSDSAVVMAFPKSEVGDYNKFGIYEQLDGMVGNSTLDPKNVLPNRFVYGYYNNGEFIKNPNFNPEFVPAEKNFRPLAERPQEAPDTSKNIKFYDENGKEIGELPPAPGSIIESSEGIPKTPDSPFTKEFMQGATPITFGEIGQGIYNFFAGGENLSAEQMADNTFKSQ